MKSSKQGTRQSTAFWKISVYSYLYDTAFYNSIGITWENTNLHCMGLWRVKLHPNLASTSRIEKLVLWCHQTHTCNSIHRTPCFVFIVSCSQIYWEASKVCLQSLPESSVVMRVRHGKPFRLNGVKQEAVHQLYCMQKQH